MPGIVWLIIGAIVGIALGFVITRYVINASTKKAAQEADDMIADAKRQAETMRKEAVLEAKDQALKLKQEVEAEKTLFSGISIHTNYLLWVIIGLLVTAAFIVVLYKKEQKLKKRRAEQATDGQEAPVVQDRTVTGDADTETEKKE